MAASAYIDTIQQMYIAYFGRPADPTGLNFWANKVDAAGGKLDAVISGFSASNESQALFGNKTTAEKVNAIYTNLFNRSAEPAGLNYWVQKLDSGEVSQAGAMYTILSNAGAGDVDAINNKLATAKAFTAALDTTSEILGYSGAAAADAARTFLQTVNSTAASKDAALAVVDTTVASVVAAHDGATGQTFTLTEALAAQANGTLSANYSLTDATVDLGALAVADVAAAQEAAQAIVAGATNAADLTLSSTYTLADSLANLTAADAAVVSGAASYTLTDAALTAADVSGVAVADLAAAQTAAVDAVRAEALVAGAANGADIPVNNGAYTLADTLANLTAADAAVVSGAASYTLTDAAGNLGSLPAAELALVRGAANFADYTFGELGQTLELTTAVETPVATAADDTLNGVSSALSSAATLNAGDKIDGGDGNDTLNVDLQSNFAGFSSTGGLSNVETVNLTNNGAIARTFDAKGVTGVQNYVLNGEVSLQDLASTDAAITLNGQQKTVTLDFATAAVSGSADALNLSVNNVGTADDQATATTDERAATAVTATNIETLNLTTAGVNVLDVSGSSSVKTVNVGGTGSLDTNVAAATKTFDASANSGAVKVDLTNTSGATTVATGAGDDTIKAGSGDLAINATIAGGDGNDTLALNSVTGTVQYQMSGVETVSLAGSGDLTFSAAKSTGIQTVEAASDFSGTATFAGLGSSDIAFDLKGAHSGSGSITADQSGASTITVTASDATIQAADATASGDANNVALTLSNSSSVNLSVGEYASYQGTITAGKATSVEISGNVSGAVDAATATAAVLNTTGISSLNLTAGKLTDLSANVAAGTVDVPASLNLSGSSDLSGVQSLTANVGANSTLITGNLAAINSINLSGAGQANLGNLDISAKDYGVNLTATGLENVVNASGSVTAPALTIGKIVVGAGQTINLNVADVAGDVTLTSGATVNKITSSGDTGTITVNANGTQGAVNLGALTAKTVTVDAANVAGTVTVGAVTSVSGSISINADAVTDGVKLGALSGGSVTVDAQNVTLASGSTADAVDVAAAGTITATTGSINVNVDGAQGNVVLGSGGLSAAKDVIVDAANVAGTVSVGNVSGGASSSIDINVSGATKAVTLNTLTAKNVSVDASDALGTVTVDNVSGSATSGSIDINVSGTTGDVTLGTLSAKNVSVDATDALGAVTVDDVTAVSGSIDINANGTTGLVTLGDLSAKNVTVDATDALGGVSGSVGITVGDTLVFNGSDLNANSAGIVTASGSTSLNATLNGGIKHDVFTITGDAATLKYTVAGDLEIGANTVSVNASAQVDSTKSVTIDTSALKSADVSITGGAGNDTIKLGAATETVEVSTGKDTISGFTLGTDKLVGTGFSLVHADANGASGSLSLALAGDSLTAVLDAAFAGSGGTTPINQVFEFAGNTYVAFDASDATAFGSADTLITLTGVTDVATVTALGLTA